MPVAIDGTGSIAGLTTALSVAQGGTGAVTAGAALTTLGAPLNATVALTGAYTVVAADRGKLFDCSGTFTVTLTAAATLGAGFSFAVRNSGTGVVTLDPAAAELVDGVATITYEAAVSSLVTCNGTAFNAVGKRAALGVFHVRDEKAASADGGSAVAGNQTRTLNTVVKNTISGASLAANDITLPAGKYSILARAPVWAIDRTRARLFNVTAAANEILGSSTYSWSGAGSYVQVDSVIKGEFSITAPAAFRIIHFCLTAAGTSGLGTASTDTFIEVYTDVFITKVA